MLSNTPIVDRPRKPNQPSVRHVGYISTARVHYKLYVIDRKHPMLFSQN